MTVPHLSNQTRARSRSPRLPPHGKHLARITPGLEPALVDNTQHTIESPDTGEPRSHEIAVAGPAALLVAKATKIQERHVELAAGRKDRARTQGSVDRLRLLRRIETDQLIDGFARHRDGAEAEQVSRHALTYFSDQFVSGDDDEVCHGILRELDDPVMASSYSALMDELLASCAHKRFL